MMNCIKLVDLDILLWPGLVGPVTSAAGPLGKGGSVVV